MEPMEVEQPHVARLIAIEERNHKQDVARLAGKCTRCFTNNAAKPYRICDACRHKQIDAQNKKKKDQQMQEQSNERKREIDRSVATLSSVAERHPVGTPEPRITEPPRPAVANNMFAPPNIPFVFQQPSLESKPRVTLLEMAGLKIEINHTALTANQDDLVELVTAFLKCNLHK